MSHCAASWDPISMSGNPTKSQAVNYLILGVKRHAVRGQGVMSCVQWPFEWEEFVSLFVFVVLCLQQVH